MEKRVVLFVILSAAIWFGMIALQSFLFGPPQRAAQQQQQPVESDDDTEGERKDVADPQQPEEGDAADAAEKDDSREPSAEIGAGNAEAAAQSLAPQVITLGEFGADSPSNLLVVISNQGAAVERIEIVERTKNGRFRYRNLDDRSGYLGYLGLEDAEPAGCTIRVVPPGTPAAAAKPVTAGAGQGLKPGDLLVRINKKQIQTRADAGVALEGLDPGSTAEVEVIRTENGSEQNLVFKSVVSERPLAVIGAETKFSNGPGPNPRSFQMSVRAAPSNTGAKLSVLDPGLNTMRWEVARQETNLVEFRIRAPVKGEEGEMEYVKRYRLVPDAEGLTGSRGYHLELEVEFRNLSPAAQTLAYQLNGPNGLPTEGWWYLSKIHPSFFGAAGARDVIWSTLQRGHQIRSTKEIYDQAMDKPNGEKPLVTASEPIENRRMQYIAVDTQYFTVALLPPNFRQGKAFEIAEAVPKAVENVQNIPKNRLKLTNTSFRVYSEVFRVEPEKSHKESYVVFAGPKDTEVLAYYNLGEAVYYGWFPWIAKPLAAILHVFYAIVGNYGLAIIMLTVLVRACMLPIGLKAARSAAMMQQMAPELKKIAEKYKNDMEKRVQAQRELYAKYKFNPFGGCLLMFIQLPIFIGLYRCLAVDIELRQAPLIPGIDWASNLAGPDMLWRWPLPEFLAGETGWLGPYLNILPIITIVLFLVQQKLFTPPATDEQTRMQQQMIKYMMIFMGIMFFKVPSGLCIYFIASSVWGICERLLMPKPQPVIGTDSGAIPRKPPAPGGNGNPWKSPKSPKAPKSSKRDKKR